MRLNVGDMLVALYLLVGSAEIVIFFVFYESSHSYHVNETT